MRHYRSTATVVLALVAGMAATSPCLARRPHGTRGAAADNKPANAGAAVCRTRARDYAYEKHADVGQERLFFETCMGH